ncbi:protein-disulfide reductase DsbD N-terminal domain-containing protein [Pedobacter metabolipauper]|uniref:Disulfide bond corrector protein DsbC n=1 Tax=Pedobacter metabolipauper TaxID=425513 RepID=A0A4R6T172_9SPHI|nr:protein-disulfide reductase DsbD domain-containing protein [Pedobacter metabolipauper]TDQ11091.1 disulfide bond corrector protein DsbC [Pedobacter metabolipauper]
MGVNLYIFAQSDQLTIFLEHMKTNKLFVATLFIFLAAALNAAAVKIGSPKSTLKVLYVGYSPDKPMPANVVYYSTSVPVVEQVYKARMADFKTFLESRFSQVEIVDVRNYTPAMSDRADVTIMDAGPVNLPADFDRPMILMHAMAPNVGLPIGLKFDWYCQCLDDDALNINTKHEIFNSPNKVKLTMVNRPTPGSFFNGFQGANTPKEMPMWKVVKEEASANGKYVIGMVAHGEGFNDSPDAEAISGGVCLKNAEAVSLGRQGNYFMWGFSASPDYMTDEAKDVFVNTVAYIKKYDHMPAIVKKVQITTREGIDEMIYRTDRKLYDNAIVSRKEGNARMLKMQKDLLDRKAAGEDIGRGNEMFLKMPITNDVESFEDYLKTQNCIEMFNKFGTNTAGYIKYYKDNYEYYYPSGTYSLQLDEDAQKLGISNRKVELLEKCVRMLEKNENAASAQKLLERYTVEKFSTAAEWRTWLTKNKGNLFFTEAGGFKFMVNTYGKRIPVSVETTQVKEVETKADKPTLDDPVAVSAKFVYSADKKSGELIVNAALLKGWHIYALVPSDSPFIPTETKIELPEGAVLKSDWQTSAALPFPGNDGVYVFEDQVSFKISIDMTNVKSNGLIKCGLFYQTCDENKCFPPVTKMVEVRVPQSANKAI